MYNLKLYTSNLTEYEKRLLEEKREQKRADFWKTMSPEERADYILKLQTGGQILSFAMIDAWNANPEIIIADEPTTALDVTIQAQMFELMRYQNI